MSCSARLGRVSVPMRCTVIWRQQPGLVMSAWNERASLGVVGAASPGTVPVGLWPRQGPSALPVVFAPGSPVGIPYAMQQTRLPPGYAPGRRAG